MSEKYDEKAIKTEDIELCSYFQNSVLHISDY